MPTFKTERIWPGDPGPDLILTALKTKVPKLAPYQDPAYEETRPELVVPALQHKFLSSGGEAVIISACDAMWQLARRDRCP